ncbi:MAG: ribosome biogenesis GTPase YlqF [Eubacteriales bacterium]|jgi:ribosome biogenesis GTPase A|nr:ribosome biogenesis GTPase YlqF [Eubacteriales bacterium]MDD3864475.1 ribosome biogenesis GTPase YlqF [Eubacteriales bacterium]MDD4445826.1 ribosome biogenesis GTPase YlqF [Eubacteriales bacterium]
MEQINWYPGHMKKTRELIAANLKMVDVVCELLDARIPLSSRNPIINDLIINKRRIVVLNKSDLADPAITALWKDHFRRESDDVLVMNSVIGSGVKELLKSLERIRDSRNEGQVRKRPLRLMIVGVPNVGKSSLINRLTGKKGARTGNKPGVTRGKQWLNLGADIQLLDTPGILWPKFEDPQTGLNLAFCGSVKDETMDLADLALALITRLSERHYALLEERYHLKNPTDTPLETMEAIAGSRGYLLSGGRIDYERTARTVLDEFRSGTLGRVTLEYPSSDQH